MVALVWGLADYVINIDFKVPLNLVFKDVVHEPLVSGPAFFSLKA